MILIWCLFRDLQESPIAFGLHPNAEIGFRMKQAETIFLNIRELQPRYAFHQSVNLISLKLRLSSDLIRFQVGIFPVRFDSNVIVGRCHLLIVVDSNSINLIQIVSI